MLALAVCWAASSTAHAGDGIDLSVEYTADYITALSGADDADGEFLDNLDIGLTLDLDRLAGWRGATFYAHLLNNSGEAPNDQIGTLQGVDNIEVDRQRLRLYEVWLEAALGAGSVRAGLYDLNSEFYVNEAAGLLIAPAFGVGSELAATGANGPSIFPSTALSVRIAYPISEHALVRFAALNASAGVLGDPDGVETSFDEGALLIGEFSWQGETTFSAGGWTYTDEQDDIRDVDGGGDPISRRTFGAYMTLERGLWSDDSSARAVTGFARVGVSDGDTTPFTGGWQAGVLIARVFDARPDSQISFGVNQGRLSDKHRANEVDVGVNAAAAETGFELTYSDQITPWLRVQPDLQFVIDAAGDRDRDDLWVAGLRIAIAPFAEANAGGSQ